MMACFRFNFYLLILLAIVKTTECKKCDVLDHVETVLNSVVTLKCPWSEGVQVIWENIQGDKVERVGSSNECSSLCTIEAKNSRAQQTLCRVRTEKDLENGFASLIISHVEITDAVWHRCTVQNTTCYEVKITVKDEPQLQTPIEECKTIDPIEAVPNKSLRFKCPVDKPNLSASQLIWGTVEDAAIPITRCPSQCTTRGTEKPLCERTKTMEDGSLIISPFWSTDSQFFWCAYTGSSNSCLKFKIKVKEDASTDQTMTEDASTNQTIKVEDLHTKQSPQDQTDRSTCTDCNTNAKVIIIPTISVLLFVALLVGGYCFRKWKKRNTHPVELENPYDSIDETINNDFQQYSLVRFEPPSLFTFKDK